MGLIMRRNLMAAKSGYTAKDYVHDGLIAMWDGIENAGYAADGFEHDPNATTWKDLVGSRDLSGAIGLSTTNDSFVFVNGGISNLENIPNALSCECVVRYDTSVNGKNYIFTASKFSNGRGKMILFVDTNKAFCIGSGASWSGLDFFNGKILSVENRFSFSACLGSEQGGYITPIYYKVNGSDVDIDFGDYYTAGVLSGCGIGPNCYAEICQIRVYSRPLSAIEIAANCAIDKVRFNIPDIA